MSTTQPAFARPATPASKAFHLMRLQQLTTRSDLVQATGLSQPTVTRAVTSLLDAGLITERSDLIQTQGRGRPTIPLELADIPWLLAGVAVGTTSTYIGLFDIRGRTLRGTDLDLDAAALGADDFIEHVMAGLNKLGAGLDRLLVSVGMTFPGHVTDDGVVDAPSLNWHDIDVAGRLRFQFSVPVIVSAAVPAILGSELQNGGVSDHTIMAFFADDSVGAAVSEQDGVRQLPIDGPTDLPTAGLLTHARGLGVSANSLPALVASPDPQTRSLLDDRASHLGDSAAQLVRTFSPHTMVVAGSAFVDDPAAPRLFAQTLRSSVGDDVELRMIPTHREIVRAIARAAALDRLLRDPLALG